MYVHVYVISILTGCNETLQVNAYFLRSILVHIEAIETGASTHTHDIKWPPNRGIPLVNELSKSHH